jgi:hypothetical protein
MVTVELYSWSIVGPTSCGGGAAGVSDSKSRVFSRLSDALRTAPPGSRGLVHQVTRSLVRIAYSYDRLIARAELDPETGMVIWQEFPLSDTWWHTEVFLNKDLSADILPPEAIAAGLADLDTEKHRKAWQQP